MNLLDLVHRQEVPEPWAEGEKIPWNDPEFSRRMLKEHLSQAHDAASRRAEIIDRQVAWIHDSLLKGQPSRILDLGCGPGLYTSRLAALGHTCVGIDFGPASIEYARQQAGAAGLDCHYHLEDVRRADYGRADPGPGYRLVMFLYGEINVFRRSEAEAILQKAHAALEPGGLVLLEPHTYEFMRELGQSSPGWYSSESGLFSPRPYLCLRENFWDAAAEVTTERYFVVDAATGEVTRHASSMQAYSREGYADLLRACGFQRQHLYSSLTGQVDGAQAGLVALVAYKG
ncbi:MAG: class I SAM-dependent methyltransferase [Anaerolineae bacterium]